MVSISTALPALRQCFNAGITRPSKWRTKKLQALRTALLAHEDEIYQALYADLHKPSEEAYATELAIVLEEIKLALSKLTWWMRPERVKTNLLNFPSSSYIIKEPKGTVLIIGPWNYPLMLLLGPLVGAIAAGNTVVLKPSEYAPATATVMRKIINAAFAPNEVLYVEGDGAVVVPEMMSAFRFDHIFFTGGKKVAAKIFAAAAEQLVPLTLELGGKSPCLVTAKADITVAAKRIAMAKFSNAGQMCIAPDYVLVDASVKEALVMQMIKAIQQFFGDDPKQSSAYGRIINEAQYKRLVGYLQEGKIIHGAKTDASEKYIEPTLLDQPSLDAAVMSEEIFGPVLPIITVNSPEETWQIIQRHPDPLAFYIFSQDTAEQAYWTAKIPFGGGCINNASLQFTNSHLPFGGRGASGIGSAHGKYSFDTFSHHKSILKSPTWFDPSMRYPPFTGKLSLLKKIMG
ncbi:MAG: aldehyde dehydrogenase family protein [Bacteroidetes bacterium]|nr:aldehyde dehydrogenase family protein [Bacteroidota bacterium]